MEGARVRLLHGVHRARRQGEREHAVLLPFADLAGTEPRQATVAEGLEGARARRGVQERHRRHARVACAEADGAAPERRCRRGLPRPPRPSAERGALRPARAVQLRLRRDRDCTQRHRLRPAGRGRAARRGLPERNRQERLEQRKSLEAVTRIAQIGLGQWGKNLVRNFADLADLRWICDVDDARLREFATRYPTAHATTSVDELLADDELDAIVVATPVPTHYELSKRVLEAGKHVFVEKPPAMRGAEMEELCELAEDRGLVLMPGHLLLYHPGVQKLKELVDSGELGDVLCVYGNRQNLGTIRTHENALWSLGVHDLSVLLYLVDEEPSELWAHGNSFLNPGVEDVVFCYLRFPSGKIAHMHLSWLDPHKIRRITVVGRDKMVVFDDMELERKITVYDKAPEQPTTTYGEWRTRTGDIYSPKIPNTEPLRLECEHFLALVQGKGDQERAARDGLAVVRALEQLQASLEAVAA
ncbi:MAG: Gfo/Idh/MocA family oxidoreductase [Actinobacteria bacterium]|nr:MAG: Gfo/Idh/MocA family oxidoreductase [Actinomycetota bacterium]